MVVAHGRYRRIVMYPERIAAQKPASRLLGRGRISAPSATARKTSKCAIRSNVQADRVANEKYMTPTGEMSVGSEASGSDMAEDRGPRTSGGNRYRPVQKWEQNHTATPGTSLGKFAEDSPSSVSSPKFYCSYYHDFLAIETGSYRVYYANYDCNPAARLSEPTLIDCATLN